MQWNLSVVVATYNAPRELNLVLTGLQAQSAPLLEVLVADDGSTRETAELIETWQDRFPVPLRHVWHEDRGFRKPRIVNRAVRRVQGDYTAFLDGDTVPHHRWAEDHLAHARPTRVLCGRRRRLGPEITPKVTPEMVAAGGLEITFGPVWRSAWRGDTSRLARGMRLPGWFSWCLRARPRRLMGCNFSLPTEAFLAVNGYDEEFVRFGGEDNDLGFRLANAGYRVTPLLNRACVSHLYHEQRSMSDDMRRMLAEKKAQRRVRCALGVDGHA